MSKFLNISREYEQIRERNKEEQERRKLPLYNRFPRLKEIENEMIRISIDITRAIINKSQDSEALLEHLRKRHMDLKIERAEILSSNNYPIDYLEIRYQCKNCKDTGFINGDKCSCLVQKEIASLFQNSNLGEKTSEENFDQFRLDYYSDEKGENNYSPRDNMKDIYMKCIRFVQNFDNHNINLLIVGNPGLGKTFLCNSIAKDMLEQGKSVIYQVSSELIDLVRESKFSFDNEENNTSILNEIYNCDLLIIDDLGTELPTQFSSLVIYNILNKRLLNNKKLIISTNLNTDEIMKSYSERIYSRLFGDFNMFKFYGEDIRLKRHSI
ncbi:MAG: ATP-binding protein [Clostridiales bacterium]|nr:ATP-binding protein [Clostridiales bacterium]